MNQAEATESGSGVDPLAARGLVMACDIDLRIADATRVHTIEVARGFVQAGLAVDLIARGPDPDIAGVRYTRAGGAEAQRLTRLMTINAQTIRQLWRRRAVAKRFYVRDKWTCSPTVLVARLLGYHVVIQVDGIPYGPGSDEGSAAARYLKRLLAMARGRLAHGLVAMSPGIRQLLIDVARVPGERILVIPNGVDLDFFTPLDREHATRRVGLDEACRYVVFCGGLYPSTDFPMMLDAFAAVVAEQPQARLLLVGDGPERMLIETRTGELDLEDRVILTGMVHDRERIRDYLGAATVGLLAYRIDQLSRASGSPMKLMEYLAAGRAVAGLEIPGLREVIERSGAGVVVTGGSADLARGILTLLDVEVADRLGAAGRRYAEQHMSWSSVIERTLPLFRLPADGR